MNPAMLHRLSFHFWYYFRPPWDKGISPPELLEFIARHPPGRAIDLGCGSGTNVITLARHGWQVTGVDFAPRAIALARRKLRQASLQAELHVADVTRLEGVDGPFDLALDVGCFHGVLDRRAYLHQLQRILRPGAHWLLYGFFRPAGPAQFQGIDRLFALLQSRVPAGISSSDLEAIQQSGFTLLWRKDGSDRRGRPSAWFLFQKG
uniref:Methyltransferase type 11 n=1 Tax=uncultured Chloroflexota bacterium TaxID=166587 RepID=H5SQ47_9CHLR|nr:methyltransferase type 11 [uncultured Chloroflexota bacterium]